MYKGIQISCYSLLPEIVDVDFDLKQYEDLGGLWIRVVRGGVTGYESADAHKLIEKYPKRSVFDYWLACAGTFRKYNRLEIPMAEVIKFLLDQDLIEVTKEYGYIKKILWKDNQSLESTTNTPKDEVPKVGRNHSSSSGKDVRGSQEGDK